ncbi:MAG: hypothetical protein M1818_006568 [Claussenomyces sp. TS43310]|nr:MAG: hypothetical protein M1818_006568 [Claussenomyces sp. TS43310]
MGLKLLILGATGATGKLTVEQALAKGHKVTVYVRESQKLPSDVENKHNLTVIEGDLASGPEKLRPLLPKVDAIISILGPTGGATYVGTAITEFYEGLLEELRQVPAGKRPYLLAMGTQSIIDPDDGFSLFTRVHILTIKNLYRRVRAEIIGIGRVFKEELKRAQSQEDDEKLDWTVYRLNLLKDYGLPLEGSRAGYVGKDGWIATMDRAQLATWLLEEAESKRWNRKLPALWGIDSHNPQYS